LPQAKDKLPRTDDQTTNDQRPKAIYQRPKTTDQRPKIKGQRRTTKDKMPQATDQRTHAEYRRQKGDRKKHSNVQFRSSDQSDPPGRVTFV
jgi:hypothetical protein